MNALDPSSRPLLHTNKSVYLSSDLQVCAARSISCKKLFVHASLKVANESWSLIPTKYDRMKIKEEVKP